jgi:hypothetical protein
MDLGEISLYAFSHKIQDAPDCSSCWLRS